MSRPLARITLLAAGALVLAGCASGYSLVQPGGTGAGSYYTSDGAYPPPAYYYDYGAGVYDPYSPGYGYWSLYGPSITFGLGLGGVCGWSCAGYQDGWPWYYGGIRHHEWRHRHHHHGDPVASNPSPRPWLRPDHARLPPRGGAGGTRPPLAVPERPVELDSAAFAPHGSVPMPRPAGIPDRPAYPAPQPGFAERPMQMMTPHDFARPAARTPTPPRVAPPTARNNPAPSIKIP